MSIPLKRSDTFREENENFSRAKRKCHFFSPKKKKKNDRFESLGGLIDHRVQFYSCFNIETHSNLFVNARDHLLSPPPPRRQQAFTSSQTIGWTQTGLRRFFRRFFARGRGLVLCPPRYKSSLDAINSLRRANIRVALEFFTAYLFAVEK